ncbi:hypothetical protein [Rubritalea tangerina]|uniref:Concanavalin A-like lectin/glucanase n=1 Tax=Rubritalea tangerina TaxID=430798 RepID=A0ABW4ZDV4_9BACT
MRHTTLLALLLTAPALEASPVSQRKDSSDFDFFYDMSSPPEELDLDNNGEPDWKSEDTPTLMNGSAVSDGSNLISLYQPSDDHSIFRSLNQSPDASWTIEIRVAKIGGESKEKGWFAIATSNKDESNSNTIFMHDNRVVTSSGDHLSGTQFADGNFHTIRVAHIQEENAYFFWVDGILINTDKNSPIYGDNGSRFTNSTFIGDYSSGIGGAFKIDYMALTKGAYAPNNETVIAKPEPKPTPVKKVVKETSSLISIGNISVHIKDSE